MNGLRMGQSHISEALYRAVWDFIQRFGPETAEERAQTREATAIKEGDVVEVAAWRTIRQIVHQIRWSKS